MNFKSALAVTLSAGMLATGFVGVTAPAFAKVKAHRAPAVKVVTTNMVTGKMIHKKGWPKFTVSTFHAKAGQTVKLIIHSYDDGNAPVPASFTKVKGTFGNSEFVNGKKMTTFKAADVAHTMTIMAGNQQINVVVPVRTAKEKFVTVTAEFKFAKAGKYTWQCEAACGTGSSGWMGPMMSNGWMRGTWNVAK